jgi:Snf7
MSANKNMVLEKRDTGATRLSVYTGHAMLKFVLGETPHEKLARECDQLSDARAELERRARDLERDIVTHKTLGNNAINRGDDSQGTQHFRRVATLEQQVRATYRQIDTLSKSELQLQDAHVANVTQRSFSRAARAAEAANNVMPVERVRSDVQRAGLAREKAKAKAELLREATEDSESDDDELEEDDASPLDRRAAVLREQCLVSSLPPTAAGVPGRQPMTSPLASGAVPRSTYTTGK